MNNETPGWTVARRACRQALSWVLTKFLLTVVTIVVLLQQMEGISYMAKVAAETTLSNTDLLALRRSLTTHATGGLLILLALAALSIFKPRGMTRYGGATSASRVCSVMAPSATWPGECRMSAKQALTGASFAG